MHRRTRSKWPARWPALAARFPGALACAWLLAAGAFAADAVLAVPEPIELDTPHVQTAAGARLADTEAQFRRQLAEDPAQAVELAKDLVAQTVAVFGDGHANVARALTNLALAQSGSGAFPEAIANFRAAIDLLERAAASTSAPQLGNPLRGLADAYMANGDIELAIPVYERIVRISHIHEGPRNLAQVPVADALSRAWLQLGERRKATRIQESLYRLQRRHYGAGSDGYVDALLKRARWYQRVGGHETAAASFRRAEQILTDRYGENDVRLIEPLVAFASSAPRRGRIRGLDGIDPLLGVPSGGPRRVRFRGRSNVRYAILEARRAVERAVRVARANDDTDPALLPTTLVAEGDWLMRFGFRNKARAPYIEAWSLLDADPALHALRDTLFSEPTLIVSAGLDRTYDHSWRPGADDGSLPERGFVALAFSVDRTGRPVDVRIAASEPAGLLDAHVLHRMPKSVYRPAFRDGEPVEYEGVRFRHQFRYDERRFSDRERAYIERISSERAAANAEARQSAGGAG